MGDILTKKKYIQVFLKNKRVILVYFLCSFKDALNSFSYTTYFEKHNVMSRCRFIIGWMLALLFNVSYCVIIKLLEIVGAKDNMCKFKCIPI